jgi:hypothetical protein
VLSSTSHDVYYFLPYTSYCLLHSSIPYVPLCWDILWFATLFLKVSIICHMTTTCQWHIKWQMIEVQRKVWQIIKSTVHPPAIPPPGALQTLRCGGRLRRLPPPGLPSPSFSLHQPRRERKGDIRRRPMPPLPQYPGSSRESHPGRRREEGTRRGGGVASGYDGRVRRGEE